MDNAYYGDELGYVNPKLVEGETTKKGLGKCKKVAATVGGLAAGSAAFVLGCKGAQKIGWLKEAAPGADPTFLQKVAAYKPGDIFNAGKEFFSTGKGGVGTGIGQTISNGFSSIANSQALSNSSFLQSVFNGMANYPLLSAAGLAGAGFFVVKGIKKLFHLGEYKNAIK